MIEFNGQSTVQSFLLDTGNQTSSISTEVAAQLGVRFQAGTEGTAAPILESFDVNNPLLPGTQLATQFTTVVMGIGGIETIAGFYLDRMQMKTLAGDSNNDDDPMHLNFISAPVYVQDIALTDPSTQQVFTLAGIIGMNYLMASFDGSFFNGFNTGPFDTIVLNFDADHPSANTLGLYATDFVGMPSPPVQEVPLPLLVVIICFGLFSLLARTALADKHYRL